MSKKQFFVALALLFGLTACSKTTETETEETVVTTAETQEEEPALEPEETEAQNTAFVGKWINEGEQSELVLQEDGTCTFTMMEISDEGEPTEVTSTGTWQTHESGQLRTSWTDGTGYQQRSQNTFEVEQTDAQTLLKIISPEDGTTAFAFYRMD